MVPQTWVVFSFSLKHSFNEHCDKFFHTPTPALRLQLNWHDVDNNWRSGDKKMKRDNMFVQISKWNDKE